jgi:hypothetical protein
MELARRYFTSRGPATVRDFSWWSGLLARDAALGLQLAAPALESSRVGGATYWSGPLAALPRRRSSSAHLIPCFDEYLVAYRDRGAAAPGRSGIDLIASPQVLVDGKVVATWMVATAAGGTRVVLTRTRLTAAQARALAAAIRRYERFVQP